MSQTLSTEQMQELKEFLKQELHSILQPQKQKPTVEKFSISRTEMIQVLGRSTYEQYKEQGLIPFLHSEEKKGKHEANRKLFFEMLDGLGDTSNLRKQFSSILK